MMGDQALRFPIGQFEKRAILTRGVLEKSISDIETFPARLRSETTCLSDKQLDTPYRPGGWTVRQVVNHCADSHMNSLIRFKLALTENKPVIKPYEEALWAELPDGKMQIEPALQLLDGIHARWTVLLRSLSGLQLKPEFYPPRTRKRIGSGRRNRIVRVA
jgi:hypothetical protein